MFVDTWDKIRFFSGISSLPHNSVRLSSHGYLCTAPHQHVSHGNSESHQSPTADRSPRPPRCSAGRWSRGSPPCSSIDYYCHRILQATRQNNLARSNGSHQGRMPCFLWNSWSTVRHGFSTSIWHSTNYYSQDRSFYICDSRLKGGNYTILQCCLLLL